MGSSRLLAFWAGIMVVSMGTRSLAAPIRYQFGGVVVHADSSTWVTPGSRYSGTLTYDPDLATKTASVDWNQGFDLGPLSGMTVDINGRRVYSVQGGLQLGVAQYPQDHGGSGLPPSTHLSFRVADDLEGVAPFLVLRNLDRWVLPGLIPPTALSLTDFPDGGFVLSRNPGGLTLYQGTLDTLTAIPVPEPTTAALILIGAAGWRVVRRRRDPGPGGR